MSKWVNSPSKGIVVKREIDTRIGAESKVNTNSHYDGDLISFDYKPVYTVQESENNVEGSDKVILFGNMGSSNRITVVATVSATMGLDEISAVQMRRIKKDLYNEDLVEIDGSPALLFSKKDEFENVVLSIKNNKILTVSMTSTSNDTELAGEFETLLNSVKWK